MVARSLRPAPPVDLAGWAVRNVRFGTESPFPGPFDLDRFPFYRRLLECLSPEHPARVVVLRGSAQIGKTVIAEIFLGGTQDLDPGPFLYVHPTEHNAHRWVRSKWRPMIRSTPALSRIFESRSSKEGGTSLMMQERRDGQGMLIVSGANSAAALSMISARRQVQDDLSKWSTIKGEGDPEGLADDRSKAFVRGGRSSSCRRRAFAASAELPMPSNAGPRNFLHVPQPPLWPQASARMG